MSLNVGSQHIRTSIIDNQGENTLHNALDQITTNGYELWIATAFFSLDALNMMGSRLDQCQKVRLLFGGDAAPTQRKRLLEMMRIRSDADLVKQREQDPLLPGLQFAKRLIEEGRLEARVYTKDKFHAKAYLAHCSGHPPMNGILGSGNFTRPGLTQNIELNVHLTIDQTQQLETWFEDAWTVAEKDNISAELLDEIRRQLDLYDPYAIYQKALLAWGKFYQGDQDAIQSIRIKDQLDPHQEMGFTRALEVLDRENGVLVCDGVGLGKSFIALALMEHFCRLKKNVLLIAPKSIMESSWKSYLERYLEDFRQPFGTISEKYMTDLAFPFEDKNPDKLASESTTVKRKELQKFIERADVIVIDESHNFRTSSSQRYQNLYRLVESQSQLPEMRKKVVLLSATPINTKYTDLSAQVSLITHEQGTVAGLGIDKVRHAARILDIESRSKPKDQREFDFNSLAEAHNEVLDKVLGSLVIQRKRRTCIELARAAQKTLLFPNREKPQALEYELSDSYKQVVKEAYKRFEPAAEFFDRMKKEREKAAEQGIEIKPTKMPAKLAIKFAAYLPEQYRTDGQIGKKNYQTEVMLAGLVFVNTLKQLESSPPAFQGILQSLGIGLIARLEYVFGEDVRDAILEHADWVRTPINRLVIDESLDLDDDEEDVDEGENAELNGTELDEWLERVISQRHLHHKLADFKADQYDVQRWKKDILNDLRYLKEIHREVLEARQLSDFKLLKVTQTIRDRLAKGQRIVVFTQSQRTAFYLEKELQAAFPNIEIARIDSNVKQETRDDILYAFCPKYNPEPRKRERKDVRILICTDVLSEGVNMQEAECILNYDIHWNPVRLIQRIGRVDRRLDPAKNPEPHTISILNCLPPDEINDIIGLVNTVEDRRTKINRTMGIDTAFFKSTDPEGTLKEFNAQVDGEPTLIDQANTKFVESITNPDPEIAKIVEHLPPGAFGVWQGAPVDGVFALFEMVGLESLSKKDADHFRSILKAPILALHTGGQISYDAGEILNLLTGTVKGEKSGDPSDEARLKDTLKSIKSKVNQSFRNINLVSTIQPKLVCWMELRK